MRLLTNTTRTGAMLTVIYNPSDITFRVASPTLGEACLAKKLLSLAQDSQEIIYGIQKTEESPVNYDLNTVTCIGHRGHGEDPFNKGTVLRENTIDSFCLAHSKGAQMVEMDVHLTSDNELVVYHDIEINKRMIPEMTYSEFLEATNSSEELFMSTNTKLETILRYLPAGLGVYLEIKYDHSLRYSENYDTAVLREVIGLLQGHLNRPVLFASFSPLICLLLKSYAPAYKTCLLIGEGSMRLRPTAEEFCKSVVDFVETWNMDGVVIGTEIVGLVPSVIDSLLGKRSLLCYGDETNNVNGVENLRKLGFTGFCTDNVSIYFNK